MQNSKCKIICATVTLFCLFLSSPATARAEVTCCTCRGESCIEGPTFACIQGSNTCETVCSSPDSQLAIETPRSCPWIPHTGEGTWARGDTVTCCACISSSYRCSVGSNTCNTICGSADDFMGHWLRMQSSGDSASSPDVGTSLIDMTSTATPPPQSQQESSAGFTLPEPQAPKISLPIPGFVGFSQVKVEGEEGSQSISIPWIAEYVRAIYNYVLAIIGGFASFIFIYAGFKYVLARGDRGKITKARSLMTNALVGLFLVFGANLILYTINPDLTSFKSIRLGVIKREELNFELALLTTTVDTIGTGSGGESSGPAYSQTFENCPLTLSATFSTQPPNNNPRVQEFVRSIASAVHGSTPNARAVEVAEAAAKCGVHFGSCGRTVNIINAIAGLGSLGTDYCPLVANNGCTWGNSRRSISSDQNRGLRNLRCTSSNQSAGCVQTAAEATRIVRERLRDALGSSWPDSWANELQPGDAFIVYNGNSDPQGTHSAIFMGWGTGGQARVVQGAINRPVSEGTLCIKSSCGENMKPLTKTFRAQ